jgi:hypothetical protein
VNTKMLSYVYIGELRSTKKLTMTTVSVPALAPRCHYDK